MQELQVTRRPEFRFLLKHRNQDHIFTFETLAPIYFMAGEPDTVCFWEMLKTFYLKIPTPRLASFFAPAPQNSSVTSLRLPVNSYIPTLKNSKWSGCLRSWETALQQKWAKWGRWTSEQITWRSGPRPAGALRHRGWSLPAGLSSPGMDVQETQRPQSTGMLAKAAPLPPPAPRQLQSVDEANILALT